MQQDEVMPYTNKVLSLFFRLLGKLSEEMH